jgi:hypothetical protein
MKTRTFTISLFSLFLLLSLNVKGQKLVIEDNADILSDAVDSLLVEKFKNNGVEYTLIVDFKKKCDYLFANLYLEEGQIKASLHDCKNQILGRKNLGNSLRVASKEDQATLIYYALLDMIKNPQTTVSQNEESSTNKQLSSDEPEKGSIEFDPNVSEHDSRYFFAPTARPLKKSELYYNTVYFLLHDAQFGITDRLSFGMGTTIIGFPFYFTTKFSIPAGEKSYFAIGDLLILGTYGSDFNGNLLFANYTYGSSKSNFTIGGGLLTSNTDDLFGGRPSFVANVSGIKSIGKYFYLITENYINPFRKTEQRSRDFFNPDGSYAYTQFYEANYQKVLWFGITGLRLVTKKNALNSFQIGLTHVLDYEYETSNNNTSSSSMNFTAVPTISFTKKFKLQE